MLLFTNTFKKNLTLTGKYILNETIGSSHFIIHYRGIQIATAQNFTISDYGAVSDTTKLSTEAINKAINACFNKGGGRVIIRAGKFKSGTIVLKIM